MRLCFFIKDTEDKEKEKTKINRQESKDKSESESSKPPAPRDTRVDSGGSTAYEVPPVKGNDPIRIQCREMLIKSLKLDDKPGKLISIDLVNVKLLQRMMVAYDIFLRDFNFVTRERCFLF